MEDAAVKQDPKPASGNVEAQKSRPTNCAQSNKRIRRKDWYYRNGKYFANKQCFKLWVKQEAEKAVKAAEEAAAKASAAQSPEQKPA